MNGHMDEQLLMDYLYGELAGIEKERAETYLRENPTVREELEQLIQVRQRLAGLRDKEVLVPSFTVDSSRKYIQPTPYLKNMLGIAATLLLLMVAGRLTEFSVRSGPEGWTMGFGPAKEAVQTVPSLTPEQVNTMIASSLAQYDRKVSAGLDEMQKGLQASVRSEMQKGNHGVGQTAQEASLALREQVKQYMDGLQEQNRGLMKEYFQLSAREQKKFMEDMMVDFASYVQRQRNGDMENVYTRLSNLEQNNESFKKETAQVLTKLVSTSENGLMNDHGMVKY